MNKQAKRKRSLSRLMAVQVFFQYDFFNHQKNLSEIITDVVENYALNSDEDLSSYRQKIDEDFLQNLLVGLEQNYAEIDDEISPLLKEGKTLRELDSVVLNIIRFAAFELKFIEETPAKVAIDEYVDLAASFFDEKKVKFVNAIVENLAKKFRKDFDSNPPHHPS